MVMVMRQPERRFSVFIDWCSSKHQDVEGVAGDNFSASKAEDCVCL